MLTDETLSFFASGGETGMQTGAAGILSPYIRQERRKYWKQRMVISVSAAGIRMKTGS